MSTLEAVAFTVSGGCAVMVLSLGFFGVAVRNRSTFIAPRATARPPDVIYNPRAHLYTSAGKLKNGRSKNKEEPSDDTAKKKKQRDDSHHGGAPTLHCQDRGSPMLGWITWTMSLSYDTMLSGIPGTGTRNGGLSGSMLRVGLDGIVLLRFHVLGAQITFIATILCLGFLLPMYIFTECYDTDLADTTSTSVDGEIPTFSERCAEAFKNRTNYQHTTLANIPSLPEIEAEHYTSFQTEASLITGRLYAVGVVYWLIILFTCWILHKEWITLLAMRRVYYLEYDVWGERRKELKQTLLYDEGHESQHDHSYQSQQLEQQHKQKALRQRTEETVPPSNLLDDIGSDEDDKDIVDDGIGVGVYDASEGNENFHNEESDHGKTSMVFTFEEHSHGGSNVKKRKKAKNRSETTTAEQVASPSSDKKKKKKKKNKTIPSDIEPNSGEAEVPSNEGRRSKKDNNSKKRSSSKPKKKRRMRKKTAGSNLYDDLHGTRIEQTSKSERHLVDRDPWIPHPEQRDTVPNVALYSILVGNLPSLPEQAADGIDTQETINFSKRQSIDWQLSLTTTFFDHCVPNQPGFSSSVAAVTIVPSAHELANSWKKWYAAASKLRRLRFIREQIALRRHYEIDNNINSVRSGSAGEGAESAASKKGVEIDYGLQNGYQFEHPPADVEMGVTPPGVHRNGTGSSASNLGASALIELGSDGAASNVVDGVVNGQLIDVGGDAANPDFVTPRGIYDDQGKNSKYYQQVLGGGTDYYQNAEENDIYESFALGPEQAAVYSREFAQAAAPCCPRGCNESRIRNASIDELIEMERTVAAEVHHANLELREARNRATLSDPQTPVNQQPHQEQHQQQPDQHPEYGRNHSHDNLEGDDRVVSIAIPHHVGVPGQQQHDLSMQQQQSPQPPKAPGAPMKKPIHQPSTRFSGTFDHASAPVNLGLETELFKKATSIETSHHSGPVRRTSSMLQETHKDVLAELHGAVHGRKASEASVKQDDSTVKSNRPSLETYRQSSRSCLGGSADGPIFRQPNRWEQVEAIVAESQNPNGRKRGTKPPKIDSGSFKIKLRSDVKKGVTKVVDKTRERVDDLQNWAVQETTGAVTDLARESTYAVVTFTSRQAAVAARHCLADGRGAMRWETLKDMPIPPLADAAAWDIMACRNCCRPLTLSINDRQKNVRNYAAMVMLGLIYAFYTIPLTAASSLVDPDNLTELIPHMIEWSERTGFQITRLVSGFITAMIWTAFFASCPVMFKAIANFGSKATSVANAEFKALQYYWWFMVMTAFSGQLLARMFLNGINEGFQIGSGVRDVLREIADTIPSEISISWLNWMIFRSTITLPLIYLLQVNTFLFDWFGFPCVSRSVRGGGPGGPTPYRIYVDSGVALMCTMALAPASPLVAPVCLFYFAICQPLLRRNLIFMYRPKFDGGGLRWPFIFDMFISCMSVGAILLAVQMGLKAAVGPAVFASTTLVPILLFSHTAKRRYLRAYEDAALLQTSLLDGWDTAIGSSMQKREEFRQFLVDAHKAAYVPICLAGTDSDQFLTAEPAVVLPTGSEMAVDDSSTVPPYLIDDPFGATSPLEVTQHHNNFSNSQHGAQGELPSNYGQPLNRARTNSHDVSSSSYGQSRVRLNSDSNSIGSNAQMHQPAAQPTRRARRMSQAGATFRRATTTHPLPVVRQASISVSSDQMSSWHDDEDSIVGSTSPFQNTSLRKLSSDQRSAMTSHGGDNRSTTSSQQHNLNHQLPPIFSLDKDD